MTDNDNLAAELLFNGANAFAAYSTNRLLEKRPQLQQQIGAVAFEDWKEHFRQCLLELSAALAEAESGLFSSRIGWSKTAFEARRLPVDLLRESLICLREVLAEELPDSCRKAPQQYIDTALQSLEKSVTNYPELEASDPLSKLALRYLAELLEGNAQRAIQLVFDAQADGSISWQDASSVLMNAQREIGRMWHQAEISIAEEHFVTSSTERAMSILAFHAEKQPANGLTVVSAAVAGNAHKIGIRVLADYFEIAGWRSICLGCDTPPAEVAQAVQYFDASLVLLSASLSTQLKAIRHSVKAIRDLDTNCKIMVGGNAFAEAPQIWQQLGADAFAMTPSDAVETGWRLVNSPD